MFKIKDYKLSIPTEFGKEFYDIFKLINSINNLHESINEQPVNPDWRDRIQRMEFIRAVQGTVALEGSNIELEDVKRVAELNKDEPLTDVTEQEAKNALEAYDFIREWSASNPEDIVTEPLIKQIHTILTRDIEYYLNNPGQYRNQPVQFGYPKQTSALLNAFEIQEVMEQLVRFINTDETDVVSIVNFPLVKAILTHYLLTYIHPFIDGNGRVSRAVEALIMRHYGRYELYVFPITARYYYEHREQYFKQLRNTDNTGNPIPFILFSLNGLNEYLIEIKNSILDQVTRTLILDYAHQLRRSKKLLKRQVTLLENAFYLNPMEMSEFIREPSIRGLYQKLSESTRKRDIAKLASLGFIKLSREQTEGKEQMMISVNWDRLKMVTLRLDQVPHRPE